MALTTAIVCLPPAALVGVRDILRQIGGPEAVESLLMLLIVPWIFGALFIVPAALFFPPRPDTGPSESEGGGDDFDPPDPPDLPPLTDPHVENRERTLAGVA